MSSEPSKAKHPTPVKTKTITIPRIPQDITNEILDHLATDPDPHEFLRACALVSRPWVQPCRRHLFHTVNFTSGNVDRWLETFPVPEEGPAHYVRALEVWIVGIPEEFFEYHARWFANMERMYLIGYGGSTSLRRPSLWRVPQSVTSLAISSSEITLTQLRDLMAQLPNLDNLSLSGPFVGGRTELAGSGAVVRGRFGGRLILSSASGYDYGHIIDMLLEFPPGLRFTEVQFHCTCKGLPSTVRIGEACGKTVVKLLHKVESYDDWAVERSFDFSKFPNLQEVSFCALVGWRGKGLPWIHLALSTLRPVTSPHVSAIRLKFTRSLFLAEDPAETLINYVGDDLRRIADEITRIEHEFGGVVNLTVLRDSVFGTVLDILNILQGHGPIRPTNWEVQV